MFVQSLVERASEYTRARNAKTMTTSHLWVVLFLPLILSNGDLNLNVEFACLITFDGVVLVEFKSDNLN